MSPLQVKRSRNETDFEDDQNTLENCREPFDLSLYILSGLKQQARLHGTQTANLTGLPGRANLGRRASQ